MTVVRTQPNGSNDTFVVTADTLGDWIVQVDPDYFAASQNNLTFSIYGSSAMNDPIVIYNAAYGDVFICGGQSNMNENVAAVFGAAEVMASTYPYMRLFSVSESGASTPQFDVNSSSHVCTFPQFPIHNSSQLCNTWQVADQPTIIGSFSAVCFYTALSLSQLLTGGRVLGMIHSSVSGTPMKQWSPPEALAKCYNETGSTNMVDNNIPQFPSHPIYGNATTENSTLFNAMINPLVRYAVRGVIWDQGESDGSETENYFSCLFQALIESWRRRWRIGDFAWIFVQLGAQDSVKWPQYWTLAGRAAQASALPGAGITDTTGMAVTYDIGDMFSPYPPSHVHSRRKAEVGRRVALSLMHTQYALQYAQSPLLINLSSPSLMWSAPTPTSLAYAANGALSLTLSTLDGKGFYLNETADAWETCVSTRDLFQVALTSTTPLWTNASFSIIDSQTILVTPTIAGTYPFIRYAPNLWPQCAIYSVTNDLPVAPFVLSVSSSNSISDTTSRVTVDSTLPKMIVTPRVPGAWADGWRGRALPPQTDGPAATPPMGFNSWNSDHCNVDENILRKTAEAFVSLGLTALGYTYINVDDCYQVDRLPNGTIIADPTRFPNGMRSVADYIKSLGMKFGLYTAQREFTCQMRPGSWRFEELDIDTYCDLGVEYVKTDACDGRGWNVDNVTWIMFREGIERCTARGGAPIFLSVESCSDASCGQWIGGLANSWRTTGDIQATWHSIMSNLDNNNLMADFAGPGHFNDPDLLTVGNAGISQDEARSHFAAWSVVAAPLIISNDIVSGLDAETLAILSAPEVIAVDQDVLGVQGVRVSPAAPNGQECWARPLADGSVAALLLNRGDAVADVECSWVEMGLKTGNAKVRDLWERTDLGNFTDAYTAKALASHASMLIKVILVG